jgi:hypothetical protein
MIIDGKERGWIEKYALATGVISNDVFGEAAVEDKALKTAMFADTVLLRTMDCFINILAAGAAAVRSNEDLSAASPITFTIDAQPDVPRTITFHFDSHAQITAFSLTITGIDARGNVVSETRTQASGFGDWETVNAYATITSIIFTRTTGTGAADTMDVGIGSKLGLSNKLLAASGVYKVTKNKADYPAASYTAEETYHTVDVSTGAAIVADDNFVIQYKTPLSLAS